MTFLAMVIALSLHQLLQVEHRRPGDDLWLDWDQWVRRQVPADGLRQLVSILAPTLLLYWVMEEVEGWLFGLPILLASAAVVFWSLGREDYHTVLERYALQREAGDTEAAWNEVQTLWLPGGASEAASSEEAIAQCEERLLYCGYQRWFAPLFYFLLLGPAAAAAYRAVHILASREEETAYGDVLRWVDWAPARALALSFAVTGDFVAVVSEAKVNGSEAAGALLRRSARAAAGGPLQPGDLRDLLYRTSGLWLLVLSLLVIVF